MYIQSMKTHYLEGVIHSGTLDGKKVLTTWTNSKVNAEKQIEHMKHMGAYHTRIFKDGRIGFRIVGYWK